MRTADPLRADPCDLLRLWQQEPPITLSAAGRLMNVTGKAVARWIDTGVRLADGSTLRLEATRRGPRLVTSRAALSRFLERLQEDSNRD